MRVSVTNGLWIRYQNRLALFVRALRRQRRFRFHLGSRSTADARRQAGHLRPVLVSAVCGADRSACPLYQQGRIRTRHIGHGSPGLGEPAWPFIRSRTSSAARADRNERSCLYGFPAGESDRRVAVDLCALCARRSEDESATGPGIDFEATSQHYSAPPMGSRSEGAAATPAPWTRVPTFRPAPIRRPIPGRQYRSSDVQN